MSMLFVSRSIYRRLRHGTARPSMGGWMLNFGLVQLTVLCASSSRPAAAQPQQGHPTKHSPSVFVDVPRLSHQNPPTLPLPTLTSTSTRDARRSSPPTAPPFPQHSSLAAAFALGKPWYPSQASSPLTRRLCAATVPQNGASLRRSQREYAPQLLGLRFRQHQ